MKIPYEYLLIASTILALAAPQASGSEPPAKDNPTLTLSASSQAHVLSLDEAIAEALQGNPTLNASKAQEPVAKAGIILAKTRMNPKLNLQVAPVETTYHPVDMAATIQLGGKRELRIRVAKFQVDSTDAQINTMAWKIRQDTEQAFYEYAVAQKSLAVIQDYKQIAERLVAIAKKRQSVGDLAGLDVFRAEAALLDVQTLLPPAEARVRQAQRQLNLLINHAVESPLSITTPDTLQLKASPKPLPSFNWLVSQAKASRPEYKQFQSDIETQKARIRLADAGRWPDVQIGAGISMVPQSRNHYWGENPKYGPEMYAQIPLPLMDHQQGPKAIAQASVKQLIAQRQAFDLQVQQELNLAYSNLEAASQQLSLFINQILPKQKEIVATSQQSFGLGFIDSTAAITAQQTALLARTNALQTLSRYLQARIDLERAVGHPLDYETLALSERASP